MGFAWGAALAVVLGGGAGLLAWKRGTFRAASLEPRQVLGHFRYAVAPLATLTAVDDEGKIRLRKRPAAAWQAMVDAASREGVLLVPVSGFRDVKRQRELFFDDGATLGQMPAARSYMCAPPGYSEHHTGYSLDVGDGERRDTKLDLKFKDTPAFAWLVANAARHHFEMSFPEGNAQGISYEPWHWRWVGDTPSLKTFYWARLEAPRNRTQGRGTSRP
jgi:D-alanyl-D-alanine carboxypeptidase